MYASAWSPWDAPNSQDPAFLSSFSAFADTAFVDTGWFGEEDASIQTYESCLGIDELGGISFSLMESDHQVHQPGNILKAAAAFQSSSGYSDNPTSLDSALGSEESESDMDIPNVKVSLEQALDISIPMKDPAKVEVHVQTKAQQWLDGKNQRVSYSNNRPRTMMICNLPCRVSHAELVQAINSFRFGGTFEFVHLPCRNGSHDSNLGYGFVHFFRKADAERFALAFEGYRFHQKGSTKACTVKVADWQGRNASYRKGNSTPQNCGALGGEQPKACAPADVFTKSDRHDKKMTGFKTGFKSESRTMMICNIPCRVTQSDVAEAISSSGFGGTFEFVYLPCRYGHSDSNLGYGFVHFYSKTDAECFALAFDGYRFNQSGSTKACTVKIADCQGRNGSYRRMSRTLRQGQHARDRPSVGEVSKQSTCEEKYDFDAIHTIEGRISL